MPVRPVFLPGSYAAPQTLRQLPPGTSPQLQGPKLDEPPPFPEPEEVGPPEPNVDGEVTLRPAAARPTAAAWVFMPAAPDAMAEVIASNQTVREIPAAVIAVIADREEFVSEAIHGNEESGDQWTSASDGPTPQPPDETSHG